MTPESTTGIDLQSEGTSNSSNEYQLGRLTAERILQSNVGSGSSKVSTTRERDTCECSRVAKVYSHGAILGWLANLVSPSPLHFSTLQSTFRTSHRQFCANSFVGAENTSPLFLIRHPKKTRRACFLARRAKKRSEVKKYHSDQKNVAEVFFRLRTIKTSSPSFFHSASKKRYRSHFLLPKTKNHFSTNFSLKTCFLLSNGVFSLSRAKLT